jgi:CHASE2 domain-containing sensor protein
MSGAGDGKRTPAGRQAELQRLAPGTGIGARLDRAAWSALSQGAPGTWSWPKALGTVALALALAVVIFVTFYHELAFVIGLGLVYGYLLLRARVAHERYIHREAPR